MLVVINESMNWLNKKTIAVFYFHFVSYFEPKLIQ